jgi:uncharacterized repeat protein (TIGR01451 family)
MRSFALVVMLALCATATAQEADVGIELSGPDEAAPAARLDYAIALLNDGPDAAASAEWTLTLPTGLGFVALAQASGAAWSCTTPAVGSAGDIICQLASYAAGDAARFGLQVDVDGAAVAGTRIDLIPRVSTATVDRAEENDRAGGGLFVGGPVSDVFVEIEVADRVLPGADLAYTVRVGNAGPSAADTVALSLPLPATLTFVSLQGLAGPAPSCADPGSGNAGTVSCTWPLIASGETAVLQLVANVPSGSPSASEFLAQASVTATSADANQENDLASSVTTSSSIDLSLSGSAPASASAGSTVSYSLSLANAGPDTASGITLSLAVPAGSTLASFTQGSGPAATCQRPAVGRSGPITCVVAAMASGTSATFDLGVAVGAGFPHNTPLRLEAEAGAAEADSGPGNGSTTVDVTIANTVDLALSQSGPASANAGRQVTYRLTLANGGPDAARNVLLSNPIPANTSFVSVQQVVGSGFACSAPALGAGSGTVSCSAASLAAGASVAFDLVLRVSEAIADGGSVGNAASVANDVPDSDATDDSSAVTTPVVNRADLQLVASAPAQVNGGATMAIDFSVRNLGASPAQTVALTTTTPARTTFLSLAQVSGPLLSCTVPAVDATGAIACNRPSLDADAVSVVRLTVTVPPNIEAGATLNYGGTLTTGSIDPDAANNQSNGSSIVVPRVDLQVSVSNGRTRVLPQQELLYAVVATNAGPGDATGANLSFAVPTGLGAVAWTCVPASSTAACPSPSSGQGALALPLTLPAGTHLRVDLIATVTAAVGATIQARAEIATPAQHSDSNPFNNAATDSDPVSMPVLFADGFESPPAPTLTVKAAQAVAEP